MPPTYIDPKTKKTVDLASYGDAGAQNVQANRLGLDVAPPTAITASSLAPATAITVPEKPTPAPVDTATGQAVIDTQTKATMTPPVEPTPAPVKEPGAIESFLTGLKAPGSQVEAYKTAYDTSGLATQEQDVLAKQRVVKTAQGKLGTINAQLEALNAEATAVPIQVEKEFEGRASVGQQAGISRARLRENALKALPLQAQALVAQAEVQSAQGDVELAQNSMKMASDRLTTLFNLHVKDAEAEYNYNKDLRDKVYEFATAKEKTALEKLNKEDDRNFELMKDNINNAQALSKSALEAGQADLAARITQLDPKSKTYTQDLAALQGEIKPKVDTDIIKLDNGETVMVDKRTGNIIKSIGGAKGKEKPSLAGLTPEQANDPFISKLLASSGGKPITDTFAQQLNKGLAVLGQLGVLQTNIKDVSTGPIVGAFRGANPWDTNAQTIKAQLNAIVPNLARGVYGEVGVLTDNDIAQYSKTLPNLKSPDDIRNAVLGITVDLIGKSVKRTLEINAANQKDVSGFVDLYTEMQSTRDAIFSQIPGYKGDGAQVVDVTPEKVSMFDSIVEQPSQGGYFSNLWTAITGK